MVSNVEKYVESKEYIKVLDKLRGIFILLIKFLKEVKYLDVWSGKYMINDK